MKKIEKKDMLWSRGVWYEIKHTPQELAEHKRIAKFRKTALTYYEKKKAATLDEVEIELISMCESILERYISA